MFTISYLYINIIVKHTSIKGDKHMNKKNITLVVSIIFNICFIISLYVIHLNGGLQWIKNKNIIDTPYYLAKESQFETLNIKNSDFVFLGDSITNRCEWSELFNNPNIKNRGLDGDTTDGILNRLDNITKGQPKKIFLMIGINDFLQKKNTNYVLNNYKKILTEIQSKSPNTIIYVQSTLPNNNVKSNNNIINLDNGLKKLTTSKIIYVDLFNKFKDNGKLSNKYTFDGTHLNGQGYLIWKQAIEQYVNTQ
ncbi:MAG: lipolytic protein family [Clostridiaceae bacterium]|jgi:hypothetical protein|nr:lipolytic protein family [Clostridiaceae bacterium]